MIEGENQRLKRMVLELMMMCDMGLSPSVIERNWNMETCVSRSVLEDLSERGYVEHIGDEVYVPTEKAYSLDEEYPLIRGPLPS